MKQITIKSYEPKQSIVMPVIFLIIGILLLSNPGGIVEFISYILGGVFIALGIGKIIIDRKRIDSSTGDTFYSLIMIVLGLVFIFFSGAVEFVVRLVIGVWIIINALNTIALGANLMKVSKHSVLTLIIGFILLIIGFYTIIVSNLVFSTIGLVIIIYAVLEIINYIYCLIKK